MRSKPLSREKIQIGSFLIKKNSVKRVYLFIKSSYAIDLSYDDFLQHGFSDHKEAILWFYEGNYLYNRCLRLLGIRPRSRKELIDFLNLHADNMDSVGYIEKRLESFINDYAFSSYIVQKERSHNPKGDHVIRHTLQQKGISADIIDEVLKEAINPMELLAIQYHKKEQIFWTAAKKKNVLNVEQLFLQKMKQYLYTKGFSLSDIDRFLISLKENEVDS